MNSKFLLQLTGRLALTLAIASTFLSVAAHGADDQLIGQRFEIVGELYAHGVAHDLNARQLSVISLVPLRISGSEILSRQLVLKGSILTIVDRRPKRFFSFLYPDEYFVRVDGLDAPAGIPVVMGLSRGIEGKSTPLNPAIFKAQN